MTVTAYPTFLPGQRLPAETINQIMRDVNSLQLNGVVPLDDYANDDEDVDRTGATDMASLINRAFIAAELAGETLYLCAGTYRLDSALYVGTNLDLICHQNADLVAYFNSAGSLGIVTLTTAQWAAVPASPERNIRISGGKWRRSGTLSGDGLTWTGNTGNVFAFWADDVEINAVQVTGYNRGRAFLIGGHRWWMDRVVIANFDNYLNLPCPGIGGTGGIRWYSGGPFTCTRPYVVCGDDCFQAVPGARDSIGEDVVDVTYSDAYGVSIKARVCVAGLVVPNSHDADVQGSLTLGIRNVTYRTIRGEGKLALAVSNDDSTGPLGTLLFDDVRLSIRRDLDGAAQAYPVELLATDTGSGGVGPIILRDSELLNVLEGGVRARGTQVGAIILDNWKQPASSNASSIYYPLHVQDAASLTIKGGSFAGAVGSTKSILFIGRTDVATEVEYASLTGVEIAGVPDGAYAVNGPLSGFTYLDMARCRVTPLPGATDARAIRFSEITTGGVIADNDFSALGATAYVNIPAGVAFRDNALSAASVNGILYQQVAAAASVEWDGWSRLIRLTSSGPVTMDNFTLPSGYVIRDIPVIYLFGVNANTITVSNAGNMKPAGGSASLTQNTMVQLVYDHVTAKWVQPS